MLKDELFENPDVCERGIWVHFLKITLDFF